MHLTRVEAARAIATALPDRDQLKPGSFSGETAGHRWRIDVLPFIAANVDPRQPTPWVPLLPFIGLASEWEDRPDFRAEYEGEIWEAAKKLGELLEAEPAAAPDRPAPRAS